MRKKRSLFVAIITGLLLASCGKPQADAVLTAENDVCEVSISAGNFDKNTKIAGYGLSGLELLNAAQDGDMTAFSSKIADMVINECCEHWSDIAKNMFPEQSVQYSKHCILL